MSRRHPSVIPWTSRRFGKAASRFGSTSATLGFILAKGARAFTTQSEVAIVFLLGIISVFAGAVAAVLGELLDRKSALQLLREDTRKPIVYLRSFKGESAGLFERIIRFCLFFGSSVGSRFTFEEDLARVLSKAGPFVAMGKPGERFATPGASRTYVRQDAWMELVNSWIEKAGLVVIKIGTSESLDWEVSRVVTLKKSTSILLYFPPLFDETLFRNRKLRQYSAFRESVSMYLKLPGPEAIVSCRFIWFGPSGEPVLLRPGTSRVPEPTAPGRERLEGRCQRIWNILSTKIELFNRREGIEWILQPVLRHLYSDESADPLPGTASTQ